MQIEQISKEKGRKDRKDLGRLLTSTLRLLFNGLGLRLNFRLSFVSSSRRSRLSSLSGSWLAACFGILLLWSSRFARTASFSSGFLWLFLLRFVIRFFSVVGSRFFFFFLGGFLAARSSLGLFGGWLLLFVFVFVLGLWFGGLSAATFLGFRSFPLFLSGVVLL